MAEAASALLAAVGCGAAVDPLVGVQVPQLLEAAAALGTGVRTLPGVHPLVPFEAGEHGETFPTLRTGEGALGAAVDQPVTFQAGSVAKPLATFRTGERFLSGVDALVLPQVAQVVKMAAAVPALVTALRFDLLLHAGTPAGSGAEPRVDLTHPDPCRVPAAVLHRRLSE